jgi:hypothetical protein
VQGAVDTAELFTDLDPCSLRTAEEIFPTMVLREPKVRDTLAVPLRHSRRGSPASQELWGMVRRAGLGVQPIGDVSPERHMPTVRPLLRYCGRPARTVLPSLLRDTRCHRRATVEVVGSG